MGFDIQIGSDLSPNTDPDPNSKLFAEGADFLEFEFRILELNSSYPYSVFSNPDQHSLQLKSS